MAAQYTPAAASFADVDLKCGRVLEVGCGTGRCKDLCLNYVGVDTAAGFSAIYAPTIW